MATVIDKTCSVCENIVQEAIKIKANVQLPPMNISLDLHMCHSCIVDLYAKTVKGKI